MIAVRFVGGDMIDGRRVETYQGRAALPDGPVLNSDGVELIPIRSVGYAYVTVPAKAHPDTIRAKLAAEFAAGRWFVFTRHEVFGIPPTKHSVGVPLIVVQSASCPPPSVEREPAGSVAGGSDTPEGGDERRRDHERAAESSGVPG